MSIFSHYTDSPIIVLDDNFNWISVIGCIDWKRFAYRQFDAFDWYNNQKTRFNVAMVGLFNAIMDCKLLNSIQIYTLLEIFTSI